MQLFSPNIHRHVVRIAIFACLIVLLVLGGLYYNTFRTTEYSPVQPVEFSHQIHVQKLGMDCAGCHTGAHISLKAGIPDTESCLDCHRLVRRDSPKIEPLLRAADKQYPGYTGEPIRWLRVNRLPDFVNFNHQAHVTRGIGCADCHGDVAGMERISVPQNRGMRWCMECHRNPAPYLRPLEKITNPAYNAETWLKQHEITNEQGARITSPRELGEWLQRKWAVHPKTDCTACHQ